MECSGSLVLNPFPYLDMSLTGPVPQEYLRTARVIGSLLRQEADHPSSCCPSAALLEMPLRMIGAKPLSPIYLYTK